MNKIFKVIWSKSKQCYVVVSEIAKNTTGKKKIVVASILATLAMQTVSITNVQAINDTGTGTQGSVAIGYNSQAKGTTIGGVVNPSVAVGTGAYAEGNSALALGTRSWAKGSYNVSVGRESTSSQDYGIAIGYQANVSAIHGMALGERAAASGQIAVAVGANAKATGTNSFAGGFNSASGGTSSVALGESATSSGETSVAIGKNTVASDGDAVSIGTSSQATGADSVALGKNAKASNGDTIAIGQDSVADLLNGVALGKTSKATGASATALGPQSTASATYAAAIGMNSVANQEYATAIGGSSQATVQRGVALGAYSIANTASGVAGYNVNANRTNKYTGLAGNTLTSTWGAVSIGDSTNTRQITGLAAGTKDTDAVNVAQLKSVNLAFTGDNSSKGDVNLADSKLAVTGDTTYITTDAAGQGIAIKGVKKDITVSNGTASASAGMADAKNVAEAINQANADQKISYKANGTNINSVKLSDGLNFTNGTSTVATVANNGQVTYDLNTATKKSITDSEAAVKRTISLGADSGTRSSQSLNSNNVEFNVKGNTGSYITTAMVGNTLTVNTTRGTIQSDTSGTASLSGGDGLATAQNVATAINKAREGAAWDLAVNSGAAQKVSGGNKVTFKNGKNISLTQSGTTITVGTTDQITADNVTVGTGANQIALNGTNGEISGKSIKVGNTTMNTSGLTISGGPSVTTTGINAGNKAITSVGSGLGNDSNAATVGDVKSLVNGLGSNSFKLTADSTSTTAQALNKSGGLSFKVAGDSDLISTSATGDTVKVSISKGSLTNNTDGTVNANKVGVATTGDVATAVNNAVAKATGAQGLTITDGTHNGKINLKTQSLAITGTNGVDATVNNQNLIVGLNTATKTAIDNAQTAVNRTISLGADSGTASSQSLKDGNVSFNVRGKTGDYITTAMNGSTVEISTTRATINSNAATGAASVTGADGLVTAKNVSDAINKAAEAAKSGAAWNLTTNSSGSTKTLVQGGDTVDLVNGDNIEISQDGTNKKKVTIKTKKDLTVDSIVANKSITVGSGTNQISLDGTTGAVSGNTFAGNSFTTGNSVLNTTGFHITGGPSVTATGIDAGNKAITNVASGLGNDSNAATVGDVKGLVDGVGKNTFTLTADTTSTTAQALNKSGGLSFKVAGDADLISTSATGNTVTVSISKGSLTNNTDGTVNANKAGVATTSDVATAVNDAFAKATGSQGLTITDGANTGKVNLKTQSLNITGTNGVDATVNNQTVTVGLNTATKTAIDNAQTAVNRTISLGADSGTASSQSLKDGNVAFNVKGKTGDYITTAMNGNTVEVSTQQAILSNNATTGAATVTGSDGLVTAKNVADTINAVADKIKTGAAWKLTTNSSATDVTDVKSGDTVDLVNGDNIEISQDGTNKKKVTIKTKKDLMVDSIVANKSVTVGSGTNQISLDGTTGAVSGNTFAGNSFTAGNSVLNTTGFHITGGPSVTAAGIDAGNKAITNVASGGTTRSSAATVGDVQDAVANLSQNLNITDGTNNGTVDLKTQKLNVAGANGVTATVNNQTITVGLDTATKTAIDNAQTAVNRTISLGADSGTISSQSLKDGNVAFNVKGKTGDYITTAMNGNTVEISTQQATLSNNATTGDATVTGNDGLVTAKNVADTINAVADKIKTSSAWKLTTNSSATDVTDVKSGDTVDLVNGDNIEISQDGTNKKKVTIKTKKDLTVDSVVANKSVTIGSGANQISLNGTTGAVSGNTFAGNSFTAGNSVLNTTGFHITGGPSVTAAGIDAGNKAITNVASGLGNDSNAATVGDVKGLVDGVGKNTFTLTADTTSTTAQALNKSGGLSFKVAGDGNLVSTSATGDTVTVSVSQGSLTNNTDGTVNANKAGVATTGDVATAVNTAVAKATGAQELTITDGTTDGTINLKNQKLNVAGANGVTATVNNQTITVGLDTNVVNATTKGIGLTGDTGTTGNKYLKDGDVSFAVTGDSNLVSTKATTAGVQVSVDASKIKDLAVGAVTVSKDATQTDNPITVTPTTGTNAKDYAIGIDTAKLATKTELTYRANNDADANAKKVSLAKGLNFVNGTGTEATVGTNGTVSFGLDTATKTAIDNAQTAVNRTISLGADSGTASSQSLKDGNVSFNVKGKTGDYITTAMNGSTVEISTTRATINSNATTGAASVTGADGLVTAKNVSDAINKAAEAAKSGAAWNLTTNSSTTDTTLVQGGDTVDLVNGDNIEISQDGTNKKKVTIKTKKDLTVDSIVANKSVTVGSGTNQISLDGTTGAVSGNTFAGNSFTAGNSVLNTTGFHITGGPSVTAAGIDAGNKAITNVASGGTTRSNAATVGDVQDAVANLSQNLNITDGTNNGTVDLKTQKLNVAGANGVTATVNNQTITIGLDTNVVNATTKGIGLTGDTGATGNKYLKDGDVSFAIMGDGKLVTTSATATGVKVAVNTETITAGADGTITGPTTDGVATAKNVADAINAAKKAGKTEITANTGEAANATTGNISLTSTTATDGHTIYDVKLNDKVTLGSGANAVTIDGTAGKATIGSSVIDGVNNTFTTGGNKAVTLNGATGTITGTTANIGGVTVNGTANTVNGLSNTTWNGTAVSGRAATEDQLQQVSDAVNAGWKVNTGAVTGSSGISTGATSTKVSSGEEVKLQAGDNLVIDQNGKTVSYSLNKDLIKMNSATFEATGGKTTVIKGDSIVQNDGAGNTNTSNATGNTLKNTSGDETKVDAKGATVKNAAGDTTKVNATGTTVADSTGNNKSEYTKDGVTITKLGKDTVSLTHDGLNNGNNKIVNVAAGTANTDAVNVSQLKDTVANSGWKVTVGTDGSGQSNVTGTSPEKIKADEIVTFKAGNNMIVTQTGKTISYAVNPVLSGMTSATFTDSAGNTTITNGNGITIAPAGGAPSVSLTKDGLNNGGNKITNVAPGQAPTDAVNMSQLQGIGNSQVAAINQVAAEVERVGAHAAAMAALKPIQYDPLEPTQFMAGVGNYRGQTAAAIGLAHYTNDNTMFNVGVSVGGNHNMVNAGVTHKFGISAEKKNIPDRYKAGPISSIYVMQDEMTQLRSENEAYKAKLDKQQSEIDALKAAVDQLLASKA